MTRLFRSKSYAGAPPPPTGFFKNDDVDSLYQDYSYFHNDPIITTNDCQPESHNNNNNNNDNNDNNSNNNNNYTIIALFVAALRKSIVTCAVDDSEDDGTSDDGSSLDIGLPTDVRHVSHVTFDRFDGFLGLPVDLQPEVTGKPPSASIRVFGVSVESMQCSYDDRGNSVPTILLMMQQRLYEGGGLQAEGIFRINAENSQEEDVRKQLNNKGFVPHGIDVHCLAGLIKAWFRELPTGVLDSLTPEQVMQCNTEEECTTLVESLPQKEAALLDWAINLMADVVKYEPENKMNARNIAMVFAPNMTQMADPLTALIHAVQVMNFLKTLIIKKLRERDESFQIISPCEDNTEIEGPGSLNRIGSEKEEKFWSFPRKSGSVVECEYLSAKNSPINHELKEEVVVEEGILEKLNLRKGVRKLCRRPVFQSSKSGKKNRSATVDT